jgi:hypothetical protein
MGDEGGGVAVLGRDFELLVDHGGLPLLFDWWLGAIFDTIARKPAHDKASWPSKTLPVLNSLMRIAIVL